MLTFDPMMTMPQPPYSGEELAKVQNECQSMLDRLNSQILNAKSSKSYGIKQQRTMMVGNRPANSNLGSQNDAKLQR